MSGEAPSALHGRSRAENGDTQAQIELAAAMDAAGDSDGARHWIERAATAGDPFARAQRAVWRLYGLHFPRDEAAAVLELETLLETGGSPIAPSLLAVLHASGVGAPKDWRTALNRLARGAASGDGRAMAQLALLQPATADGAARSAALLAHAGGAGFAPAAAIIGASGCAASGTPPAALLEDAARAGEDPEAWKAPDAEIFCTRPRVDVFRGVAPAAWRAYVMALALPYLDPAQVQDVASGRAVQHRMRTNDIAIIDLWNSDLIIHALTVRIAIASGSAYDRIEQPQILRYRPGQSYDNHYDFIDPEAPAFRRELRERGQRTRTPLIYLNDAYDGGETSFPRANKAFRGRAGDLLILRNTRSNGAPDQMSLHAGLPPTRGEKWVFSTRIRNQRQLARIWREL